MLLSVVVTSAGVPLKVVWLRLPALADSVTVMFVLSGSVIVKPLSANAVSSFVLNELGPAITGRSSTGLIVIVTVAVAVLAGVWPFEIV